MDQAERWSVELTRTAVAALRALPRDDRWAVAARIDYLADTGLPPGAPADAEERAARVLPVGEHVLVCLEVPGEHRIVVLTVRSETPAGAALWRLVRHALPRSLTDWTGGGGMGSIARDVRFALRSLRRSPGFAVAAVLTLSVGIGATAAIFSVANGVLLRPLPYGQADEVVAIWSSWRNFPEKTWVSVPEYQYWYQQNRTLQDVALYRRSPASVSFTSPDDPEQVGAAQITPNTLSVLQVQPVLGQPFPPLAGQDSIMPVLLGYEVWQRRFSGDPSIVGRGVELNGQMLPVLGILPEGFALPVDYGSANVSQVYYPLYVDVDTPIQLQEGGSHGSFVVARLREGETVESARADLVGLIDQLKAEGVFSQEGNFQPRVFGVKADILGSVRATILVLLGAVAFVLLIACGNVANLLLSRSGVRKREVAVRTALGAGRARILRQLLTESAVLAGAAAVLGLGMAYLGVDLLLSIDPEAVPRSASVSLDASVVAFTLVVSALTALLFGLAPAMRVSRGRVGTSLRDGGRRGGARSGRAQGILVAAQMAMAVILLTGAGLMMKTFVGLLRVDTGISAENVLTMRITAPAAGYPDATAVVAFYDDLLRRLRDIPGVESAGAARILPLASTMGDAGFFPVGYVRQPNESTQADWQTVTPGYLETMGIPVIQGRGLELGDREDTQEVVLVNRVLAERFWPGESPLGREVVAMGDTAVVVGVVGNVTHNGITGEINERFYRPQSQAPFVGTIRSMTLTLATRDDPGGYVAPVHRVVREADPSMPVASVRTWDEVLSASVSQPRFALVLLGAFAALALGLALVGVYGVLAYTVSQRTREIGIRMALGAETGQVVGLVIREGMVMAVAGVAVGTVVAWFLTSLMSGLLYGVTPQDPATFASVPAVFVVVAMIACWLPAARAARVLPARALRYE